MGQNLKQSIIDHFVSMYVHDVVAAIYDCYNHRYCLALSPDDERRLQIAVNFSNRNDLTRNVLFCIETLDSILSDDLTADFAQILLDESVMVRHSKALVFFTPIVAQYIRFRQTYQHTINNSKCA